MEAKSQLLSFKSPLTYGLHGVLVILIILCKFYLSGVGSSFLLDPTHDTSPEPCLPNHIPWRHPCHTWDVWPCVKWDVPTSMPPPVEIAWNDLKWVASARLSLAQIVSLNFGVAIPLEHLHSWKCKWVSTFGAFLSLCTQDYMLCPTSQSPFIMRVKSL